MKQGLRGWDKVARQIEDIIAGQTVPLNAGQKASLRCLAGRLPQHGMIIADEVGMGKTRIAAVVARAVKEAGGRVAILRACLETHLSIMKRFNSMLAMAI